jgi:hypothetical protein
MASWFLVAVFAVLVVVAPVTARTAVIAVLLEPVVRSAVVVAPLLVRRADTLLVLALALGTTALVAA